MNPEQLIEKFTLWGSCDVADGLVKLGHAHGGFLEGLTLYSPEFQTGPHKLVGRAFPVKFVAKSDITSPALEKHYIDCVPKDAVIFISQPLPHINTVFGGLMSLRAQMLGAAGVVVDGRIRDLQEHRDLKFPVFSKGVGTTAGGAVCRASEINVPVRLNSDLQEAWINPEDYIIADMDGVVCVPKELAEQVLEAIPHIAKADELCAKGIREGRSVAEVFSQFKTG